MNSNGLLKKRGKHCSTCTISIGKFCNSFGEWFEARRSFTALSTTSAYAYCFGDLSSPRAVFCWWSSSSVRYCSALPSTILTPAIKTKAIWYIFLIGWCRAVTEFQLASGKLAWRGCCRWTRNTAVTICYMDYLSINSLTIKTINQREIVKAIELHHLAISQKKIKKIFIRAIWINDFEVRVGQDIHCHGVGLIKSVRKGFICKKTSGIQKNYSKYVQY